MVGEVGDRLGPLMQEVDQAMARHPEPVQGYAALQAGGY
jgi:hypothetical protein